MEEQDRLQEINDYFEAIGYDKSQAECHLNLLASVDERYYFRYLIRTIPNIDNINLINIVNISCLMASLKKLNNFLAKINDNVELFLRVNDKRNSTISKITDLLKTMGFTGINKDKLVITYSELEV